jgi:hypothetical protein
MEMALYRRIMFLAVMLALLTGGCEVQDLGGLLGAGNGSLPLVPIGGIPISMTADVETEHREMVDGQEIVSWNLAWRHIAEGRLSTVLGWAPDNDGFEQGHGYGREHCFSPCGPEHDLTFNWESILPFDDPHDAPEFHIRLYGDEALVLYGAGSVAYERSRMPECACLPDWTTPAGPDHFYFGTEYSGADRAPDAADSTLAVVQSGIILLRIPIADLRAGQSLSTRVDLEDNQDSTDGFRYEDRLRITLTLTSS